MDTGLRLLVVEDDDGLRGVIEQILQDDGNSVFSAKCSEDATDFTGAVDLAIVDLNLPGEDGLTLVRRLRINQPAIGIIILSARRSPEERTRGYVYGADIYLSKPASLDELRAAVSAVSRRLRPSAQRCTFRLNPHQLLLANPSGDTVVLSPRESDLLVAFCRAPSFRLDQSLMIDLLHKDAAFHPKSALELHILRIRKKLVQLGVTGPGIQSIRGWGYQLCVNLVID